MHFRHVIAGLGALTLLSGWGIVAPAGAAISFNVGVCDPAWPTRCMQAGPFVPDALSTVSLSVTTATARVALTGTGATVVVNNTGTIPFYVKLGGSTVAALTTDFYVPAGAQIPMARGTATYIAAITATSTSTLVASTGTGTPAGGSGGSSGGGTGVAATSTAAAPVRVEGATNQPASEDLHGATRVLNMDSSGNPIDPNAALPAGSNLIGVVKLTDTGGTTNATVKAASTAPATTDTGLVVSQSPVPSLTCNAKVAVSVTASTDLVTFTNTGYICSIVLVGAAAETWSLVDGTGSVCATGIAGVIGGTTGTLAFGANGGFSAVSDRAWVSVSGAAKHLCLLKSAAGNISGVITYRDF